MSTFKKERLIPIGQFAPKSLSQILNDFPPQLQDRVKSLYKNLGECDTQSPNHGDTAGKIQAQNMEALPKNRVGSLYKCSDCYYASILEQDVYDHIASHHMKVAHEGQSPSTFGTHETKAEANIIVEENNVVNVNEYHYDIGANRDSGLKEVVFQYDGTPSYGIPQYQLNTVSKAVGEVDRDKFIAMERPIHMSNDTHQRGPIKMEYLPKPVVKEKTKMTSKTTVGYKCELCDFVTNRKYDLKGHIDTKHKGSLEGSMFKCNLCDYSTLHDYLMGQHFTEFHPTPQQDQPTATNWVEKKKLPDKITKRSAPKDDIKPMPKTRELRDKHNAFERGRRLNQAKLFEDLKELVPRLRDIVKTVSKKDILDGAAEYLQVLGEQDLVLSRKQEELSRRNAWLKQRLAAAKRDFMEANSVWGQMMRDIQAEDTSNSIYDLNLDVLGGLDIEPLGVLE